MKPTTPDWVDTLARTVDVAEVVDLAGRLIRCATVNPPGDEHDAAQIVAAQLKAVNARAIDVIQAADRRESVVARWGTTGGRVLAWNGHTDVVSGGDESQWTDPPFIPSVRGGRLWGRGAVDMKGPVACVLHALAMIERAGLTLQGEVALSIAADEETGGTLGTGYLAREGLLAGADAAICGEPSSLNAVVAARGRLWLELTLVGTSAHASQPELGVNAVAAAGHLLETLKEVELPAGHSLVGDATLTPTMIAGGSSPNSVPDRCTVTIDRRLLPGEDPEGVKSEIRAALDSVAADERAEYELVERALFVPTEISPTTEIVTVVQDATGAALGRRADIKGMGGSTDARFLIGEGIPTVIFGPGDASEAHTIDESISVDDLRSGALAYATTFCQFLGVG